MHRLTHPPSVALTRALQAARHRVLLVDDDRELRGATADLLRAEAFDVTEVENGLDALLHLRTALPCPDAVVLDLVMPIMTGWEFREASSPTPPSRASR